MQKRLKHFLLFAMVALLLAACSSMPIIGPTPERSSLQAQRSASAALDLKNLEVIDTVIRLNNKWLARDIKSVLQEQFRSNPAYTLKKLNLIFTRQIIVLGAIIDINYQSNQPVSAELSGDILLDFDGTGLVWLPRFKDLQISSRNFVYKEQEYPEPTPEVSRDLLTMMTADIADPIVQQAMNSIPLDAIPLGEIQVGASLPGFSDSPASSSRKLKGKLIVAGSASLIEPSVTTIALDLSFIPEISSCPAGISVSRAMFTNSVVAREPVDVVGNLGGHTNAHYFYSEISGVKQPIKIIHYWFADGLPVAAEELPVGSSARWRTWSGKGSASHDARRWEVLVVEKESGCILFSEKIRALEPSEVTVQADQTQARQAFATLKESFKQRTGVFSIHDEKPDIALVEIQRPFLNRILQDSLTDMSMDLGFDSSSLSRLNFSATLQAFNPQDIVCEERKCPALPACKADLTQCKKTRDTRECSSCKFRNPLNNRCVSEVIDPLCEASRDRQNAMYEAEQASCIAAAEDARQACEQLTVQATQSCQNDPQFKGPMCESIKADLLAEKLSGKLARITAQARPTGSLTINFSNFRIEDDLQNLKLDMRLKSDLQLDGDLIFTPSRGNQSLADCISGWNSAFTTRFTTMPSISDLMNPIEVTRNTLTANWSGFGLNLGTNPSPIEAVFIENPQLLANCHIGLKLDQVKQSISSDNSGFFNGQLQLEIQPLPTTIGLAPANIRFWDNTYSGEAHLSEQFLRFDIEE